MARHLVSLLVALFMCFNQDVFEKVRGLECHTYDLRKGIYNGTKTCPTESDHVCFVLWGEKTEKNETRHIVISKDCFSISLENHHKYCLKDCIQNPEYDAFRNRNVSGFCCCSHDLCNRNFTAVDYEEYESTVVGATSQGIDEQESNKTVIIAVALVIFVVLLGAMAMVWYLYKIRWNKENTFSNTAIEEKEHLNLMFDLSGLEIEEMVGQGRYGCVWRGYFDGNVVAVKIFPPEHRHTWKSETEFFESHLSHPSILKVRIKNILFC